MTATATPDARVYPSAAIGWLTVTILFVLYIRSLADRYLIALLVDPIKHALGLTDFQISLLQGPAFAVLYCLCAIPVGLALDRTSRRWVLFGCVVVWSAGAASCGLAGSLAALMLARSLVGAGESGFSTGAYSMLGDSFPPARVSLAMSIFVMGGVMGAGIVFLLGGSLVSAVLRGAVANWPLMHQFAPWQQAFIITGVPGILTAFLIFAFPEPPNHRATASPEPARAAMARQSPTFGATRWCSPRSCSASGWSIPSRSRSSCGAPVSLRATTAAARRKSALRSASRKCSRRAACRCTAGWSIGCSAPAAPMRTCCGA